MSEEHTRRRQGALKAPLFGIWIAIVSIVLLWQATTYSGVMAIISEWQYNNFGLQYPTFNYVFLVFLLGLPGYLIFLHRRSREGGRAGMVFRSAEAFMRGLFGFAIGYGVAAVAALLALAMAPSGGGTLQQIAVGQSQVALPHEGATELRGAIIYERTAAFDRDLFVVERHTRFAPMVAPGSNTVELRYFVQMPPVDKRSREGTSVMRGILQRNGLPGEIVRLFRYAGYQLDEPHFVLFGDVWDLRWPYLSTAAQLALGSVLSLLAGLWQRRRIGRLRETGRTPQNTHAPAHA